MDPSKTSYHTSFSWAEAERFPSTSVSVNDYSSSLPAMSTPVRADGPQCPVLPPLQNRLERQAQSLTDNLLRFCRRLLELKDVNHLKSGLMILHTSVLESYNSMLTKYAPKRRHLIIAERTQSFDLVFFRYPYFIMRIMLAAIDHNMHLCRGQQLNAAGEERGHRKYSKRTQKFHAETVKEEKAGYSYFPFLMAKMLKERCLLREAFLRQLMTMSSTQSRLLPLLP
ncbi:hypothetical protein AWC38_SpisGene22925 [Stylophora pistillata]|uniref:Uncharacterized protein n=1 Tax=Stylophora pistillata TaxID=50429 RepID=A0A2B4R881_STYPI|nr:hypothetical protein AWC38_SpisGene22925 [Stylophora pistillata]